MKWFKLVFRQNKPLHIGSLHWGVICETEIFIPGWTMWGALTAEYLRRNSFSSLDASRGYFKMITNFYPALVTEKGTGEEKPDFSCLEVMFPHYRKGRFCLGKREEEEFRFFFTDIMMSTAVEGIPRRAKDASLHEIEYLLPRPKKGSGGEEPCQVYWIGLLGLGQADKNGEEFLTSGHKLLIYAGGERKYGLGELELVYVKEAVGHELAEWNLDREGELNLQSEKILRNFLPVEDGVSFAGETAVLAEEWDFTGLVPRIENAGLFIKPGSLVKNAGGYEGKGYRLDRGRFRKSCN